MLIQFKDYLTFENIYLWVNLGVLPFWLLLILLPKSNFTQVLVNSIIAPLILGSVYVYLIYQSILLDENIFDILLLYLSLDNLYTVFATESFLLIFWIHFLFLNLFLGNWIVRDAVKFNIPQGLIVFHLILIYFSGPFGIFLYWLIRVFYSKKLKFHD